MVDPVSDMLTRIRNAVAVGKIEIEVPYSKQKHAVADIFKQEGFMQGVEVNGDAKQSLRLILSDGKDGRLFNELHRVSKPGRRVYVAAREIPTVLSGRGVVVVSTSSGVMSGTDARRKGVGGELICKVW